MKISLNSAQYFSNIDLKSLSKEHLVEKIGAQLGAIDEIVDWAPRYEGIVVARVISCDDHPNADKLHVCKIDDGGAVKDVERDSNNYVQVVCGAPNVRKDLLVAWIPPGATVPTTYGTEAPFVLEARELRGVISNGMLASASELGLSDNHDGLLEIRGDEGGGEITPGQSFVSLFGLDDFVIDVENKMFTHRPDCFGVLGTAREIAGITGQAFVSPKWYLEAPVFEVVNDLSLRVRVEVPRLVPRFMAVAIKDVQVAPSPTWLQAALSRIGIRPINNIVDITNWVMYVTGQPLHAYDYDKLEAQSQGRAEIIVRLSDKGEQLKLLNGKTIEPRPEAVMIASTNELIGVGGVMGGAATEVDDLTKNIVLEAASFDMYSIRRTAMAHGLFTDAVTRFNKGQSPWQNDRALAYAMQQIALLAAGKQASNVIDIKEDLVANPTIKLSPKFVNDRLGLQLSIDTMSALLKNVEFDVRNENNKTLLITAPFWRTDIVIAEDIVEEIGRLYGFDHLPLALPVRAADPSKRDEHLAIKSEIRHILKSAGANELLTYSFIHGDLLQKVGQETSNTFVLSNALSPNLQYYRLRLTPSLLEKVHPNLKAGYVECAVFEMGKTHEIQQGLNDEGVPEETERLAFVYAASTKAVPKNSGSAFFKAKSFLMFMMESLGVAVSFAPMRAADSPFDPKRSAQVMLNNQTIGIIGEYTQLAIRSLKLPSHSAGFELEITPLISRVKSNSQYIPLPKFPKVSQDISLRVGKDILYEDLYKVLTDSLRKQKPENTYAILEPIDIYSNQQEEQVKHVAFRLTIASYQQTLTTESINLLLDNIAESVRQNVGAERI